MLLLSLFLSTAGAADLDVAVGYQQTQLLDQHQSPLHYAGHGTQLRVGLTERWEQTRAWTRLSIDVASLDARLQGHRFKPNPLFGGALEVGVAPRVASVGGTELFVGGGLRSSLDYVDGIGLHPWAMALNSVDLHLSSRTQLRGTRVGVDLAVPVVGVVSRHNWALDPIVPGKGDLTAFYIVGSKPFSVATLQQVRARGSIEWPLKAGRTSLFAALDASFLSHLKPRPVRRFAWAPSIGMTTALGGQ